MLLLLGCSGTVKGRVTSSTTGKPITKAKVAIGGKTAVTKRNGSFVLEGVPLGDQLMTIKETGFATYSRKMKVERGENRQDVSLLDGLLIGRVCESCVTPADVKSARITLGNRTTVADSSGEFTIKGLTVGEQTVEIEAKSEPFQNEAPYEPFKQKVNIKPGQNKLTFALTLTPRETYQRYYEAYAYKRFRDAYGFVHPRVKKKVSLKDYTKSFSGESGQSIVIGRVRMLKAWRHPQLKQVFKNVAEVDRTVTGTYQGTYGPEMYTDNYSQHWQKIGRNWYILIPLGK